MDLAREQRLAELLEGALERPVEERESYLAERCDDRELLAEAIAALATDDGGTAFFERPAAAALPLGDLLDSSAAAPRQVGEYRIEEVIGEGGMGVVYAALQTEPVERRVAVKLMRTVLAGPTERARFDTERQALARLTHPNIAQLYGAGTTDDGQPYVVMELVDGQPITEYCDVRSLDVDARLRIFVGICRAVEHAHRRQLLHRDLKPSNVLVVESEGRAVPKVIDFGIAKVLDNDVTQLTVRGILGTPAYMSPEAIGGEDVDTRADVYSLGVLLYELLCGKRPFDDAGSKPAEVLRRVQEDEPPRPSRRLATGDADESTDTARTRAATTRELKLALETDLDWIVLKALSKDREERYGSAAELAADVERYLDHEPIEARPPSLGYQLRKWSRRNRGVVVAGSLALLALVGGFVARSIEAERAKASAEEAKLSAEEVQAVSDFLVSLMSEADPETAQGEETTIRQALDRGTVRLGEELVDQPNVRARLLDAVGVIYRNLGLFDPASNSFESAVEVRRSVEPLDHIALARTLNELGWIYYRMARHDEALSVLQDAVSLVEDSPTPHRGLMAQTLHRLGSVFSDIGEVRRAEDLYKRSIAIHQAEGTLNEEVLSHTLNNLAVLYLSEFRFDDALPLYERVIDIRRRLLGEKHPLTASVLSNLGILHWLRADYEPAEELLTHGLALRQEVLGTDHPSTSISALYLANLHLDLGRLEEAAALADPALESLQRRFGPVHPRTLTTLVCRARIHHAAGERDAAREALEQVFAMREGMPSSVALWISQGFAAYALLELDAGRTQSAVDSADRAVEAARELPVGSPGRVDAYRIRARTARAEDPVNEPLARELLERAAAEAAAGTTPSHPVVAAVHSALASLDERNGDRLGAETSHRRALEIAAPYRSVGHVDARAVAERAELFLSTRAANAS